MKAKYLIFILIALLVATGLYLWFRGGTPDVNQDNSSQNTAEWISLSNAASGISFRYPADFSTTYIQPQDWPPQVQMLDEALSCTEAGSVGDRAGRTEPRVINGIEFCVTEIVEGAAGSVYTQYAYAFAEDDKTIILTFSIRQPQCANYPEPEMNVCEEEIDSFDIDSIIGEIAETVIVSPTTGTGNQTPPATQNPPAQQNPVACTMEAKLCPDGSYVGRTGPNCEFSPCPGN